MSADQADPVQNAVDAADLELNHRVPNLPNRKDPGLPNRRALGPELSHKDLDLQSRWGPEPNHKVLGPEPNHKDLGQSHRDLGLPNRPGLRHIRRAHRVHRLRALGPHQRQVRIRMPAPGRTVVGYLGQGSARADLATAVVLIRLDAAANSSLLQSILGTGSSNLYVYSGSILTDSVPILAEQRVPAHSFYARRQVKASPNIVSTSKSPANTKCGL